MKWNGNENNNNENNNERKRKANGQEKHRTLRRLRLQWLFSVTGLANYSYSVAVYFLADPSREVTTTISCLANGGFSPIRLNSVIDHDAFLGLGSPLVPSDACLEVMLPMSLLGWAVMGWVECFVSATVCICIDAILFWRLLIVDGEYLPSAILLMHWVFWCYSVAGSLCTYSCRETVYQPYCPLQPMACWLNLYFPFLLLADSFSAGLCSEVRMWSRHEGEWVMFLGSPACILSLMCRCSAWLHAFLETLCLCLFCCCSDDSFYLPVLWVSLSTVLSVRLQRLWFLHDVLPGGMVFSVFLQYDIWLPTGGLMVFTVLLWPFWYIILLTWCRCAILL